MNPYGIYNVFARNDDGTQIVLARREGASLVITPLLGMSGSNAGTIEDFDGFAAGGAALVSRVAGKSGMDHTEPLKGAPHSNQDEQRIEFSAENTDQTSGDVTSPDQYEIYFAPGTGNKAVLQPETFANLLLALGELPAPPAPPAA